MRLNRFSMRANLVVTIVAMGALAMAVALGSGRLYRDVAAETEARALGDQLRTRISDQRREFDREVREMVLGAQQDPAFARALAAGPRTAATAASLDRLYRNFSAALGEINLVQVSLLDANFQPLLISRRVPADSPPDVTVCRPRSVAASGGAGGSPARPGNSLCVVGNRVFQQVIVSIGEAANAPDLMTGQNSQTGHPWPAALASIRSANSGAGRDTGSARGPRLRDEVEAPETGTSRSGLRLGPVGESATGASVHRGPRLDPVGDTRPATHLQFIGDFVQNTRGLEASLGLPLRLALADGVVLYQSPRWPTPDALGNFVVSEFPIAGALPMRTDLRISVCKDMDSFYERLDQAGYLVALIAGVATLLAMVVALLVLEKTAITPLRTLTTQLRRVRQDKTHLGQQVSVIGNTEMVELSACFNDMTTRLKELYENYERAAFTDPLTQLPNRALFHDRLQQAILSGRRDNRTFALFIMDLDRFKDINDTLGHQVGDEVLKQVAQRLRGKLRESDTIARMGGDEFAVLLPTVNAKYAGMAARMLLQALRAPFVVEGQNLDIGASIGIALYPDHGVDVNVLIQRADVAMYAAKHTNAGHAFYESRLDENNPSRLAIMGDLRRAVEQEQFVLHFQPMVDLRAGKVAAVEALLRWNHPHQGLMLPDAFVPLLEQTGLIRSLTPWVLNEAMRVSHALRAQGMPMTVSVNLSVRDLQDPFLADTLSEQLAAQDVKPGWIKLEITESAVMTDPERALELLKRLSQMGLSLAIDDFGTGYSSLTYLKRLPVSTIKVDKSFVRGMAGDPDDAAIVRTSIDLAHNLGLDIVAEGVETEEILHRLERLGCNMVQGLYISRPLSEEELQDWLRQSFWGMGTGIGPEERPRTH